MRPLNIIVTNYDLPQKLVEGTSTRDTEPIDPIYEMATNGERAQEGRALIDRIEEATLFPFPLLELRPRFSSIIDLSTVNDTGTPRRKTNYKMFIDHPRDFDELRKMLEGDSPATGHPPARAILTYQSSRAQFEAWLNKLDDHYETEWYCMARTGTCEVAQLLVPERQIVTGVSYYKTLTHIFRTKELAYFEKNVVKRGRFTDYALTPLTPESHWHGGKPNVFPQRPSAKQI